MSKYAIVTIGIAACLFGGCTGTIIKEGAGAVMGAKGSVTPLAPVQSAPPARTLGPYQRFELGTFTDDMAGLVPPALFEDLPGEFLKALAKKKIRNAATGRTLLIRGKVLHYEDSSTVGKAVGPVEFVVAQVEFVDKGTGQVLGRANCVGLTTARVNLGVGKKAEGLGKAIANWIDQRYPEDLRIQD